MRSRLAILFMLVTGFALSGAGAGLAVSGIVGDSQQAASAQYPPVAPPEGAPQLVPQPAAPAPEQDVKGEEDAGGSAPDTSAPETNAPAERGVAGAGAEEPTQVARQLGANVSSGDQLAFTGFAAIPVLLIGVFLLISGLVLRRGNSRGAAS